MEVNKITMEIFSKLEQQWLHTNTKQCLNLINSDTKKTKLLTIDGGGTSAFVAGSFLIHMEDVLIAKTGDSSARIVDFFDIIAGTGIGGTLAIFLTVADSTTGRPLFSAREAVSFLNDNATEMFKSKKCGVFRRTSRGCSTESLSRVLKQALKRKTLKDTCKPVLIPCYDTNSRAPFVFSRGAASKGLSLDFELWKVCCAAVATPGVYDPYEMKSVDGKTELVAVDGGIVMSNPTAVAVTHVLHNKVEFPGVNGVEELIVCSVGNGTVSCRGDNKKKKKKRDVTSVVVDIAVEGVAENVDQMLGNAFSWNRHDYLRFQANGFGGSGLTTMEEVLKERGIESLTFGGKRMLEETNGDRIESFVQRLVVASGKSSLPPSPYKSLSPLLDGR